jgi:SAM-dependent methyltransferase
MPSFLKSMEHEVLAPYKDPVKHALTTNLILHLSTNKKDVRELALSGLDMASFSDVLDLGCGYGFMSQMIASTVRNGTCITGVDACEENREAFMNSVSKYGCKAVFKHFIIENRLPFKTNNFDLIVCTFSLYFFPEIIGEIARVLRPGGIFITITHSDKSFKGLYEATGLKEEEVPLVVLINKFSAENGREMLVPYFMDIEKTEYDNKLHFELPHMNYLVEYIQFKLPLLIPRLNSVPFPPDMKLKIKSSLLEKGKVIIEKPDVIFRCRRPVCR